MFKIIFKLVILFIVFSFVFYFQYTKAINNPVSNLSEEKILVIEKGDNVDEILLKLEGKNLIRSRFFLKFYLKKNNKNKIQAGEYVLRENLSGKEIIEILEKGQVIRRELKIQIIEGWTIKDIDNYLSNKNILKKGEFIKNALIKNFSEEFKFLKNVDKQKSLEGFLFPDTYLIFEGASVDSIIRKMLLNFEKKIENYKTSIDQKEKSIFEIINMAALIQKEVNNENDMKMVSGIFWNRISNKQKLESCATLAYVLGINKAQYTVEDTKIDSPYNTYQNFGLPVGPISNPGIKAIEAAINPTPSDFNFFLSSSGDKKTIFSKTYREHLVNKQKYIK